MARVMLTPVLKIYLISEWSKDIYEVKKIIHLFHKTASYRTMHFTYKAPAHRRMVSLRYRLKET